MIALLLSSSATAATIAQRNAGEPRLVKRINAVRAEQGLRPLEVTRRLQRAATRHANSMARLGYFRHEFRRDGTWSWFPTWISWYWPGGGFTSWGAGENIAWRAPGTGARKTVAQWLRSSSHRANLLSRSWKQVGVSLVHITNPVGTWSGRDEVTVVIADFGRRSR
ncbi:MAG TPA: CAP domain-containing protein [Gaiellaceae bacterium]|nr:CAP domain-containing protein [Gaiellaceae bacterium]